MARKKENDGELSNEMKWNTMLWSYRYYYYKYSFVSWQAEEHNEHRYQKIGKNSANIVSITQRIVKLCCVHARYLSLSLSLVLSLSLSFSLSDTLHLFYSFFFLLDA